MLKNHFQEFPDSLADDGSSIITAVHWVIAVAQVLSLAWELPWAMGKAKNNNNYYYHMIAFSMPFAMPA